MLWQKDSNGLYLQILKNSAEVPRNKYTLNKKKSNTDSLRARMYGNELYARNDFEGALIKYNLSICLADDSEHLSFSYANRAQCFLKMKRFEICLVDNNSAREAGYPATKISKLDARERECLKQMDAQVVKQTVTSEDTNFYHADDSAIQVQRNNVYGRMATATHDIKIGDTVLVEEMYIRSVIDCSYDSCINCGKRTTNFIPCNNCSSAMFCSKNCAEKSLHEFECDLIIGTLDNIDEIAFTLRSVVVAINSFTTINELIAAIEQSSHETASHQSKYRTFFHLSTGIISQKRIFACFETINYVIHGIMSSSKLRKNFDTTAKRRFLEHLVVHHYFVLCTNSFGFHINGTHVRQISLKASYINHSCLPNVAKLSKGNISVCKAILPIRRGEQIFITYLDDDAFSMTEKKRNDQLDESYGFRCKCTLCRNGQLRADQLENDPHFVYVTANAMKVDNKHDIDQIRKLIEHCIKFLHKHSQMIGCQEVYYIADTLSALFSKEMNGF